MLRSIARSHPLERGRPSSPLGISSLLCNCEQNPAHGASTPESDLARSPVLLCIHRDPDRIRVLQENGYELLPAATGEEGLGVLGTRPVDAIVLEYNQGASSMARQSPSRSGGVRPNIPIVLLAEPREVPAAALNAVDALVSRSDPLHFLWAAVHFMLNASLVGNCEEYVRLDLRKTREARFSSTAQEECLQVWCVCDVRRSVQF